MIENEQDHVTAKDHRDRVQEIVIGIAAKEKKDLGQGNITTVEDLDQETVIIIIMEIVNMIEIQAPEKTLVKVHLVQALLTLIPCLNKNSSNIKNNKSNKIRLRPTNLNDYFPPP